MSLNMKLLAQHGLNGFGGMGEGMALQRSRDGRRVLWLAHESAPKNFTAVDVSEPRAPKVIVQTDLPHAQMRSNSLEVSGELERIWACGRSVCTITFGARGSLTSTAVKFLGALSCASHSTRRPSRERCSAMPSPMPPNPLRPCWASSFMLRDMEPKISSGRHETASRHLAFAVQFRCRC